MARVSSLRYQRGQRTWTTALACGRRKKKIAGPYAHTSQISPVASLHFVPSGETCACGACTTARPAACSLLTTQAPWLLFLRLGAFDLTPCWAPHQQVRTHTDGPRPRHVVYVGKGVQNPSAVARGRCPSTAKRSAVLIADIACGVGYPGNPRPGQTWPAGPLPPRTFDPPATLRRARMHTLTRLCRTASAHTGTCASAGCEYTVHGHVYER